MTRRFSIALIVALGIAAAAAGAVTWRWLALEPVAAVPADFSLPDLQNRTHWLSDWHGKIVVLNFWATWCAPCREEIPLFVRLQKQYGDQVQIVGVAIDAPEPVATFAKETGMNYPVLLATDTGPDLMAQYGNTRGFMPFTVVLTRDGTLSSKKLGAYQEAELHSLLESLLNLDKSPN
jgi:thiol-disulfide isomerase/thioredoxin